MKKLSSKAAFVHKSIDLGGTVLTHPAGFANNQTLRWDALQFGLSCGLEIFKIWLAVEIT